MIGGEEDIVRRSIRSFARWRPGSALRHARQGRPARRTRPSRAICIAAPNGAGHFVKMVHNGIEYGLMAAYAEGLNILTPRQCRPEDSGGGRRDDSAPPPELYRYDLDVGQVERSLAARQRDRVLAARPYRQALRGDAGLDQFAGRVSDSGEGRWTLQAAIDEGVPGTGAQRRAVRALRIAR